MATIQKRKKKSGGYSYRVMIRQSDGFPQTYKTFPTRQEAKDWANQEEAKRRQGTYLPHRINKPKTLLDLIERFTTIVVPIKYKSANDILRHLNWWKNRLGKYALINITPDLIATCRQELSIEQTPKGTPRSSATVNRYLASLSSTLTYGVKEYGRSPCKGVKQNRKEVANSAKTMQLKVLESVECMALMAALKQLLEN